MKHIHKIVVGSCVRVLWEMPDDDEPDIIHEQWYIGTVKKIHRRDRLYVVCHLKYEDGEDEVSSILKERDYGTEWFFENEMSDISDCSDDDSDYTESNAQGVNVVVDNDEVVDSIRTTNRILSFMAFVQYLLVIPPIVNAVRVLIDQYGGCAWELWNGAS